MDCDLRVTNEGINWGEGRKRKRSEEENSWQWLTCLLPNDWLMLGLVTNWWPTGGQIVTRVSVTKSDGWRRASNHVDESSNPIEGRQADHQQALISTLCALVIISRTASVGTAPTGLPTTQHHHSLAVELQQLCLPIFYPSMKNCTQLSQQSSWLPMPHLAIHTTDDWDTLQ